MSFHTQLQRIFRRRKPMGQRERTRPAREAWPFRRFSRNSEIACTLNELIFTDTASVYLTYDVIGATLRVLRQSFGNVN
jgi:hypothetical protein